MANIHLIRYPNKKEHRKAIGALMDVLDRAYLGLPDRQMCVTDEHIEALERAKVAFTYLSKTGPNDKRITPRLRSSGSRPTGCLRRD